MKKICKACALALGAIALSSLASCSAKKDETVASIKIRENSISTTYVKGAAVNYDKLSIDLYNKDSQKIKTLMWADNKDTITHTDIDTSALAGDKVFTVTYKEGENSFEDSLTYSVIEATYELQSWSANKNYVETIGAAVNANISTDEDSLVNGFMKKGKFYVGNMNAVNLLPELNGLCDELEDTMTLDKIPDGASVLISKLNSDGTSYTTCTTSECIENESEFVKDGMIKFKESVTGSFKVTLSLSGFSPIVYEMEVVDAYNVSKATDLFAFYTSVNSYPYSEAIANKVREYKTGLGLPDAENLVIQNDIKIGKNDLPDIYFWQSDEKSAPTVVGSLKDSLRIYDHQFKNAGDISTIYGNMHTISLIEDKNDPNNLPYILTEAMDGQAQNSAAISSHASLFYASYGTNSNPFDCKIVFKDLQGVGNRGVSEDEKIKEGGPMFLKTEIDASFDNVNISKFYMAAMSDGSDGLNSKVIEGKYVMPELTFDSCRFRDCANAGIYIYGSGSMDIKKCDFAKSGGPFLFLNPATEEKLPSTAADAATFKGLKHSTNVTIDDDSFISNYTAGKGGWFEAYSGASGLAGKLQAIDNVAFKGDGSENKGCGMTFTKTVNNVSKFNLIALNLPIHSGTGDEGNESLDMPVAGNGGTNVTITKGGKLIYSTLDGYADVLTAALTAQGAITAGKTSTIASLVTSYAEKLSGTFFGNNLAFADIASGMVFTATSGEGKHESAMIYATDTTGLTDATLLPTEYVLKSNSEMKAYGVSPSSATLGDTFKSAGYLACTINNLDSAGVYSDSMIMNPLGYAGVNHYGVILGGYHAI